MKPCPCGCGRTLLSGERALVRRALDIEGVLAPLERGRDLARNAGDDETADRAQWHLTIGTSWAQGLRLWAHGDGQAVPMGPSLTLMTPETALPLPRNTTEVHAWQVRARELVAVVARPAAVR